ncbi:MAG: MgtC/SapB family protein [Anaerolineae bacterium]|nr:MgtC/SapB family protein [Anaerolineae bacterium]
MQEDTQIYYFAVATIMGALIGLEREYAHVKPSKELFGGIRTYALIGMSGCISALLSTLHMSAIPLMLSGTTLTLLIAISYFTETKKGKLGMTSQVSAILTFLMGAICYWGQIELAAAIAVTITSLLSIKPETRNFVKKLTDEDIYAILKFAIITAIVLPILPDKNYGIPPLDIINPYNIWLMVVFISGIGFLGYTLIKLVGAQRGIELTGLVGGIASSTAVTISLSERSKKDSKLAVPIALAITMAWTVMFIRVLVIIAALNAELAKTLLVPMVVPTGLGLIYCGVLFSVRRVDEKDDIDFSNPFELGPALKFGAIYALALIISKAAQLQFGTTGVYVSSTLAGLVDVNVIALSMVELLQGAESINLNVASQAILLACISNTIFKGVFALSTGSPELRKSLLPILLIITVSGIGMIFLL